jgi:tRNA 2-thiouridine synthesizing protein E
MFMPSPTETPTTTKRDNTRTPYELNAQDCEPTGFDFFDRFAELHTHRWSRDKSTLLARKEGIELTDDHWAVICFLRQYYCEHGTPKHARLLARELNEHFAAQGGNRYLRTLFPGGPVTQGCRLANLRVPANAVDRSFGTDY